MRLKTFHSDSYSTDYSHDMSPDIDNRPGRVCARPCEGLACADKKVCQEVSESDPECVCPCKYSLLVLG